MAGISSRRFRTAFHPTLTLRGTRTRWQRDVMRFRIPLFANAPCPPFASQIMEQGDLSPLWVSQDAFSQCRHACRRV